MLDIVKNGRRLGHYLHKLWYMGMIHESIKNNRWKENHRMDLEKEEARCNEIICEEFRRFYRRRAK